MNRIRIALVVLWTLLGPVAWAADPKSGLAPGEEIIPWNPVHVAGPHQGTNACPVCTYLERPAILVFAKDSREAAALVPWLEQLLAVHERARLKGFLVVVNTSGEDLKRMAAGWHIARLAVCCLDPRTRAIDLNEHYRINPAARTTLMIYRDYRVTANGVNISAETMNRVESAIRATLR